MNESIDGSTGIIEKARSIFWAKEGIRRKNHEVLSHAAEELLSCQANVSVKDGVVGRLPVCLATGGKSESLAMVYRVGRDRYIQPDDCFTKPLARALVVGRVSLVQSVASDQVEFFHVMNPDTVSYQRSVDWKAALGEVAYVQVEVTGAIHTTSSRRLLRSMVEVDQLSMTGKRPTYAGLGIGRSLLSVTEMIVSDLSIRYPDIASSNGFVLMVEDQSVGGWTARQMRNLGIKIQSDGKYYWYIGV